MISGIPFFWFDPVKGAIESEGITSNEGIFKAPGSNPWVLIIGERKFR